MEDLYKEMQRWTDDKKAQDEHFWQNVYPKMDRESKLIWWRKDVFNAMNRYGASAIPNEWIAEKEMKDPDFQDLLQEIIKKLS